MADQHGSGHAANSARYGSDGFYDGLYLCIVHIAAELALCIYIDSHVNDHLAR